MQPRRKVLSWSLQRFLLMPHFEIIVDVHAFVRNNTVRSCVRCISFPPAVTSCVMIIQFHDQEIDIDIIHPPYSGFTILCVLVYVLVRCSVIVPLHVCICVTSTIVKTHEKFPHIKDPSSCLVTATAPTL